MKSEVYLCQFSYLPLPGANRAMVCTLVCMCSCLLGYTSINFPFSESPIFQTFSFISNIIFQNICSKRHLISILHPQSSLGLETLGFKSLCTYSVGRELTVRYPSALVECQLPKQESHLLFTDSFRAQAWEELTKTVVECLHERLSGASLGTRSLQELPSVAGVNLWKWWRHYCY